MDNKIYQTWLNNLKNKDLKIIKSYSLNEQDFYFNSDLKFGTAGIRAKMLLGSSYLNKYTINRIALGYANFLLNDINFKNKGILISHDTRKNSVEFSEYFVKVLKSKGLKVFLFKDNNPEPTPIHSYLINKKKLSGGIMITASHNPADYNGIKIYDQTGCQLLPNQANLLTLEINKVENYFNLLEEKETPDKFYNWEKVFTSYLKSIKKDIISKDLSNVKVIFSSLHGTSYKYIQQLSKLYKFDLISVEQENCYDQNFKNAKSINPVESDAYFNSLKLSKKSWCWFNSFNWSRCRQNRCYG